MTAPKTFWARRRASLRGVGQRAGAMVLGAIIAGAGIVAMQLPLITPQTGPQFSTAALASLVPHTEIAQPAWPTIGSAAIDIPQFGVLQSSNDHVVPIASVTKLMTAYLVLHALPLTQGPTGPCVTITSNDVETYRMMKAQGQSSVAVAVGEQLCEDQLLLGLLVHSSSNYAVLLATMVAGSLDAFIGEMNRQAMALGLTSTHYADASGFDPRSVSTASDQARLAALLMANPLFAADVDNQSVSLPVAGVVNSFTPDVGIDGVIGVKSGRTAAAGGCDVMALSTTYQGHPLLVLSVVLGQRGGDLLTPAGEAALALARSATTQPLYATVPAGVSVGGLRWGRYATPVTLGGDLLGSPTWVPYGSAPSVAGLQVQWYAVGARVHAGDIVGALALNQGGVTSLAPLIAARSAGAVSLWQRLR